MVCRLDGKLALVKEERVNIEREGKERLMAINVRGKLQLRLLRRHASPNLSGTAKPHLHPTLLACALNIMVRLRPEQHSPRSNIIEFFMHF